MDMIEQLQVPQLLKLEWHEDDFTWERHVCPDASSTQVDLLSQIKQFVGTGECRVIDIRYPQEAAEVIFQNWFDMYNWSIYENSEFVYKTEQGIHIAGRCSDLVKSHPTIVKINYKEIGKTLGCFKPELLFGTASRVHGFPGLNGCKRILMAGTGLSCSSQIPQI